MCGVSVCVCVCVHVKQRGEGREDIDKLHSMQ